MILDYGLLLLVFYILLAISLYLINNDPFSPDKYFYISTIIFYSEIFFIEKSALSYSVVFIIGLVNLLMALSSLRYKAIIIPSNMVTRSLNTFIVPERLIWMLSMAATTMLMAHIYIVLSFGGIEQYFLSMVTRLNSHQSILMPKIYSRQITIVFLLFFCILISTKMRRSTMIMNSIIIFGSLLIIMGMQGSRSAILLPFLFSIICWHYLRKPVKQLSVFMVGVVLISSAAFLEVFRRNFELQNMGDSFGIKFANYGLLPIQIWESSSASLIAYGSTLLAGVTNLIPRSLWPSKPDTGGTLLNVVFADNGWPGSSITTGIFVEGFINFGLVVGLTFATAVLVLSLLFLMKRYSLVLNKLIHDPRGFETHLYLVWYIFLLQFICNLHVQEFAQAVSTLILTYIVISIFSVFARIKLSP